MTNFIIATDHLTTEIADDKRTHVIIFRAEDMNQWVQLMGLVNGMSTVKYMATRDRVPVYNRKYYSVNFIEGNHLSEYLDVSLTREPAERY